MSDYGPQINAARLYRRKSANGNEYFAGRWGGCKIALLKSRDVAEDGSEIWNLLLSEAPAVKGERPAEQTKETPAETARDGERRDQAKRQSQKPIAQAESKPRGGGPDADIPF